MKKAIKTLAFCAALLLAPVSCKIIELNPAIFESGQKNPAIVTACLEDDGVLPIDGEEMVPETKTMRQSDGSVWWNPGDKFSLFFGPNNTPGGCKFSCLLDAPAKRSDFSGEIDVVTGGAEGEISDFYFWGVYPYNASNTCNGASVSLPLPTNQVSGENTFSDGQWPTVAKSANLFMSFKNVCCGYKFKVETKGITKVVIRTPDTNHPLAGKLSVSMDKNGIPVVTSVASPSNEVVVTPKAGGTFKPGVYYYAAMIPNHFDAGVSFVFYTETKMATYNCTITGDKPEHPSARGKFKVMDNKDHGLSWVRSDDNNSLPGEFSVSDTKKVRFSSGNLRYNTVSEKWSFFDQQYDYGPSTYSGGHDTEISLFTWGFNPVYSIIPDRYEACLSSSFLTYSTDWGCTMEPRGEWRTLTHEEWKYLFSDYKYANTTREGLFACGVTVAGKPNCLVLYPDDWSGTKVSNNDTTSYDTAAEWALAEASGAVCLPAAGLRVDKIIDFVGKYGLYWSSTRADSSRSYCLYNMQGDTGAELDVHGMSVRLVIDVK